MPNGALPDRCGPVTSAEVSHGAAFRGGDRDRDGDSATAVRGLLAAQTVAHGPRQVTRQPKRHGFRAIVPGLADAVIRDVDLHPVRTVKTAWKSNGEALKCKLDDYNNGRLGVPHR